MLYGLGPTPSILSRADEIPRVLLAGSFICFSDRILSLLREEFPEFDFRRVEENSLGDGLPTEGLHLLICEDVAAARALDLSACCRTSRANVAVAFDDVQTIVARLAELGINDLPGGLSLLPMNMRIDAWLSVMGLLLHGGTYVPVDVLRRLAARPDGRTSAGTRAGTTSEQRVEAFGLSDAGLQKLTERERKVLPLIAQGKQNKVIANELEMSEHTVKLHVHHIISKLGVRNRTEAASYYLSVLAQGDH